MAKRKHKVYDPSKVNLDLKDPMGFTPENNPSPYFCADELSDDAWQHYFEFDDDGLMTVVCHNCLLRAKYGSGNCVNGGEYYAPCLERKLALLEERKKEKPRKTYQSTLL